MRAEYNAFVARLRAHTQLSNKTETVVRLDGSGNAVRANYIIAFPAIPDDLDDRRYTARQEYGSDRFLSFDVRVVAVDADGVLQLAEAVMGQLIGHALTVPGRVSEPMWMATDGVEEGTVQFDRTSRLFYLDASFEFWSRRG
jgi:hypothetical protein